MVNFVVWGGLSLNNHSNCEEGPGEWLQELNSGGRGGGGGRRGRQESKEVSEWGRGGFGRGRGRGRGVVPEENTMVWRSTIIVLIKSAYGFCICFTELGGRKIR
jgi:hypothetical protein